MNKIAVIAGGSKSLGKYLAETIAKHKDYQKVIILDIVKYQGDVKNIDFIKCDLINPIDVQNAFKIIEQNYQGIFLFVYNAGYTYAKKITEYEENEFIKSLNINLYGYFLSAKEAAKNMIKHNIEGKIIQINSKSGKVGSKYSPGYSAAKAGGAGLTQSMALDLADHKINVNALMIGNLLNSEMFESLIPEFAKKLDIKETEVKEYYKVKTPLKRGCEFWDVANVLMFYASEEASYCTGQLINITGGQIMF